jgi:MFS superfamily sulfate permease-like transporter
VIEFLSHSTIVGFMAGAAVTIGMSQLKNWLGYTTFTNKTNIQSVLKSIADHPDQFNWQTFLIGLTFLLFILFLKQVVRTAPPSLGLQPIIPIRMLALSNPSFICFRKEGPLCKIEDDVSLLNGRPLRAC